MGIFDPVENTINLKLVYYGPAFGGKTTNLLRVRSLLDPNGEQSVLSINTDEDTTLFFDYLPLQFRILDQYRVRVQGYTVPGQVQFNTTRRLVLKGADGVIFVADSARARLQENVDSLLDLYTNLSRLGMSAETLPVLLQYNKQDLAECLSPPELDNYLNHLGHPSLPATALEGDQVQETFAKALQMIITRTHAEYQFARRGLSLEATLESLTRALRPAYPVSELTGAWQPGTRTLVHVDRRVGQSLKHEVRPEQLLEGAVATNLELSNLLAERTAERDQLRRELRALREQTETTEQVDGKANRQG